MKKKDDSRIEFPEQKILPVNMEHEVTKSFLEYSMSVIVSRALPDARDGMKPGQRRILWAMYEEGLTSDKAFSKSAKTVGNVIGSYHPHGDVAAYGSLVRMAQDFSYRYPLIEGHGNFGSIDGDPPAAYRYTEARLAKISNEMLRDIEKNVVKWDMNFDNTKREPSVLPSRIPNLLVNGAVGIAVGMATNIPPHNLGEVIDGAVYLMDNPDAGVSELMQFIKGPDFPTGAIIKGTAGIYEAYATGRGRINVMSRATVEEDKNRIVITEIPYMVQKSELIKTIAQMHRDKRVEGITELRDESGQNGLKIVIEYRKDANGQLILNQLYKYTELQSTCSVIMLSLVGGEPKVLGLRQLLKVYIDHQEGIIRNRTKFELDKALKEAHINEGYKIAIDHIDEVITIIRSSPDTPTARINLQERFKLSEEQATAITQMTLGRLSGLERRKVEERLTELYAAIKEYRDILSNEGRIQEIVKAEMLEIKEKYGDERRTVIEESENEILMEDLIERENVVVTLTHEGYIKRQPADTYSAQKRGGRGIIGMATKEEDYIERVVYANSHSYLALFTDTGRIHMLKTYVVPEAGRTAKGSNIVNLIDISPEEKITSIVTFDELETDSYGEGEEYLVMVTERGIIKRTRLSEFRMQRKGGKIALSLDEGDRLLFTARTVGESDIMIVTRGGLGCRFNEDKVSVMGRSARGVKGISLREGDLVAGACVIERSDEWLDSHWLAVISTNGYGKRLSPREFEPKGRGIQGNIVQGLNERVGEICGVAVCREGDDLLMITGEGTIIRTPVSGIPVYGRGASGVIVMKLGEGSRLANFTVVDEEEDEEGENSGGSSLSGTADAVDDGVDEAEIPDGGEEIISGGEYGDEELGESGSGDEI